MVIDLIIRLHCEVVRAHRECELPYTTLYLGINLLLLTPSPFCSGSLFAASRLFLNRSFTLLSFA